MKLHCRGRSYTFSPPLRIQNLKAEVKFSYWAETLRENKYVSGYSTDFLILIFSDSLVLGCIDFLLVIRSVSHVKWFSSTQNFTVQVRSLIPSPVVHKNSR